MPQGAALIFLTCIAIAEGAGTDHTAGVTASGRVTAINDHRASGSQDVEQLQVTDQDLKTTAEDQDQAEDDHPDDHPFLPGDQDGETDDEEYEEDDPGDERQHQQWVSKSSWAKNASDPAAQSALLDLEEVGASGLMRRVAPHDPEAPNNASSMAQLGSYSTTTCKVWGRRRTVAVWTIAHDHDGWADALWTNWRRRCPSPTCTIAAGTWRSDTAFGSESGTCFYFNAESECQGICDGNAACKGYDRYNDGAGTPYCCFKSTTLNFNPGSSQNAKNRRRRYSHTCDYAAVKKSR